jgi:transposase-like protein
LTFQPPHCPHPACPAHRQRPFPWRRKGFFQRRCDGRAVQRFLCLTCRRSFSSQSFRLDYRLHRPSLSPRLFQLLASKVTMRQAARIAGCNRKAVDQRLLLLGRHCRDFQARLLAQRARQGGLSGRFQLDELETFEHDRRLCPLTVPVLIEQSSYFVLHACAAALPARGRLRPRDRERRRQRELRQGKRRSGSRQAVQECWSVLGQLVGRTRVVEVATDSKLQYESQLWRTFGRRVFHLQGRSKEPRVPGSLLFPINHTLAMMRDGISRLVRRSWAASKKRERLELHQWIWIAWRNYVRGVTNKAWRVTPAMALGLLDRRLRPVELLRERVFGERIALAATAGAA